MANNERVSQLIELFAADLHSEDLFLITDMSQRESKKLELGQLLLFFENSGSFIATNADNANTASYVRANNIDGIVAAATFASQSVSSSWAFQAVSSSFADDAETASFATWCATQTITANTASFLQYSGGPNGTASYAVRAALADNATTAFSLFYNGSPNGTASWAVRANNSNNADTASFANNLLIGSADTTGDGLTNVVTFRGAVNDGAALFMSGTIDAGTFYIRTGDNGTEPVVFQSHDSNAGAVPVTRVSINYSSSNSGSTRFVVDGNISASSYTSSISNASGFLGTASFALSASSVSPGVLGPKFITPVVVVSTTTSQSFTTFSASAYLPAGATVALLDYYITSTTVNTLAFAYVRNDPSGGEYILSAYKAGSGGHTTTRGGQGQVPLNSQRSFQYGFTLASTAATIRLIGYY